MTSLLRQSDGWRGEAAAECFGLGLTIGPWVFAEGLSTPPGTSLEAIAALYIKQKWPDPNNRPPSVEAALLDGFREFLGHPPT